MSTEVATEDGTFVPPNVEMSVLILVILYLSRTGNAVRLDELRKAVGVVEGNRETEQRFAHCLTILVEVAGWVDGYKEDEQEPSTWSLSVGGDQLFPEPLGSVPDKNALIRRIMSDPRVEGCTRPQRDNLQEWLGRVIDQIIEAIQRLPV